MDIKNKLQIFLKKFAPIFQKSEKLLVKVAIIVFVVVLSVAIFYLLSIVLIYIIALFLALSVVGYLMKKLKKSKHTFQQSNEYKSNIKIVETKVLK